MNTFQIYLYIWAGLMVLTVALSGFVRWQRGQKSATTQEFIAAGFALVGTITFFKVLLKVMTQKSLQVVLEAEFGLDGTAALCIGAGVGLYLSCIELKKLF